MKQSAPDQLMLHKPSNIDNQENTALEQPRRRMVQSSISNAHINSQDIKANLDSRVTNP